MYEWSVFALFRDEAVLLSLVFQKVVEFLKYLVVQIPAKILVAVGEEVEDILSVFAAHTMEVVGYDVTCQAERIEVGD